MSNKIEDYKKELLDEIKALASDISNSSSFVGLLSNELKFNSIHEKFLVLKFLERKRLGFEILDEPLPVLDDETEETFEEKPEEYTPEQTIEAEIEEEVEENVVEVEEEYFEEETEVEPIVEQTETAEIEEEEEMVEVEETIDYPEEKEYTTEWKIAKSYPPIQLDLNDKIAFQSQLFDSDKEQMNMVLDTLNRINSLESSKEYIEDLQKEMMWNDKVEYVERLTTLVEKRFD